MKKINSKSLVMLILNVALICELTSGESSADVLRRKICIQEASVNPSLVDKANEGEFSDNRELQCYFKCYHRESGIINESGDVEINVLKSKVPQKVDKKVAQQAIDRCKTLKKKDACENAYELQKCLYNNKLKL